MTLTLALSACATAANRRALYFPARPKGPWHDYEKRRLAEAQTGVSVASMTTTTTTMPTPMPSSKPTKMPPSRPLPETAPNPALTSPAMPAGATTPDATPATPPATDITVSPQ